MWSFTWTLALEVDYLWTNVHILGGRQLARAVKHQIRAREAARTTPIEQRPLNIASQRPISVTDEIRFPLP